MNTRRFGWLVSYPRSGSTWLRLLLSSLLRPDRPVDINAIPIHTHIANRSEFDEHLGVESSELSEAEIEEARPAFHAALMDAIEEPVILRKVHDRFWHTGQGHEVFPAELSHGAVYIVRDPRDVALSLSAYKECSVDEAVAFMNDPSAAFADHRTQPVKQLVQPMGTWGGHVESWLDQPGIPVHILRYEDLSLDPARRLAEVAGFLGLPAEGATAAAERVRFSALQEQEQVWGFREKRRTAKEPFFRQGRVGAWRSQLDTTQRRRLEDTHAESCKGSATSNLPVSSVAGCWQFAGSTLRPSE